MLGDVSASPAAASSVELPLSGLRFAPNDLQKALGQQTLVLAAALEAVEDLQEIPWERTGVIIGIETDPDVAWPAMRRHLVEWSKEWGASAEWLARAMASSSDPMDSALVLGAMPNIPANRLNRQFGAAGPSFTVSAGEQSGLIAVDLAVEGLRRGDIDAAVVGAVDLSVHPVHSEAVREVLPEVRWVPGDAAVVLVLKRAADAEADRDRIFALLDPPAGAGDVWLPPETAPGADRLSLDLRNRLTIFTERFGHAYAASGMLHLAAAALCLHHRSLPSGQPWTSFGRREARILADNTGRAERSWSVREAPTALRRPEREGARFHIFTGRDATEVLAALDNDLASRGQAAGGIRPAPGAAMDGSDRPPGGPARLVIVASSDAELSTARPKGASPRPPGSPRRDRSALPPSARDRRDRLRLPGSRRRLSGHGTGAPPGHSRAGRPPDAAGGLPRDRRMDVRPEPEGAERQRVFSGRLPPSPKSTPISVGRSSVSNPMPSSVTRPARRTVSSQVVPGRTTRACVATSTRQGSCNASWLGGSTRWPANGERRPLGKCGR